MRSTLNRALVAGAAGTLALEAVTYLDIAIRGRAPSSVPDNVVGRVAERAGIDAIAASRNDDVAQHRRSGVGALAGYATGIGIALLAAPMFRRRSKRAGLAGLLIGGAAMAVSDTGAAAVGATDPRTWGLSGWLSDALPHAVYGFTVAAVLDGTVPSEPH